MPHLSQSQPSLKTIPVSDIRETMKINISKKSLRFKNILFLFLERRNENLKKLEKYHEETLNFLQAKIGNFSKFILIDSKNHVNFQLEQNKIIRDAKFENTKAKREKSRFTVLT